MKLLEELMEDVASSFHANKRIGELAQELRDSYKDENGELDFNKHLDPADRI
jgi:hypothetical protein